MIKIKPGPSEKDLMDTIDRQNEEIFEINYENQQIINDIDNFDSQITTRKVNH